MVSFPKIVLLVFTLVIQECFSEQNIRINRSAQSDWSDDDQNIPIGGNAQSDWLDEDKKADHVSIDFSVSSRCHPNPCENNGFCHDTEEGISCTCAHGFLGHRCQGWYSFIHLFVDSSLKIITNKSKQEEVLNFSWESVLFKVVSCPVFNPSSLKLNNFRIYLHLISSLL